MTTKVVRKPNQPRVAAHALVDLLRCLSQNKVVIVFFVSAVLVGRTYCADQSRPVPPHVIATAELSQWMLPEQSKEIRATLAFISDNSVALRLCEAYPASDCRLVVLQFDDGIIHVLAQTKGVGSVGTLFRSEERTILNSFNFGMAHLYSSDLFTEQQIPRPSRISISGKTMAVFVEKDKWTIYRIRSTGLSVVREASGELIESLSDRLFVVREKDTIRAETMDGRVLGSFKVKPATKCATFVEVVDETRLYLDTCGRERIVDYSGKELVQLHSVDGWGFRHGWSADGSRLLYDKYTRTIPFLQSVQETAVTVATVGLGTPEQAANGEAIRVVDTATGNTCFDWKDQKHLIGAGDFHADISPSGKFVAMVTGSALSIYRLPDSCTKY